MHETKPARILTIDDEDVIRQSFRFILEDAGYEVLEAENGRVGLEILEQEHPDLLLVDLRMPEVDGLQVLARTRQAFPDTPVVVVSGTGVIADVVEALRLGAWDYLLKPIPNLSVLMHTIEKNLERSRLRREKIQYQHHLEETLDKLRQDEEAGRRIQTKLLPPPACSLGGYALSHLFMPSLSLSGDFVDYFAVNDSCIAFYTADVSGHGVSSALVTVLLKSFMRKHLENYRAAQDDTILHPDTLLAELNKEILREDLGKHLTLFYGLLKTTDNTLTFANGGQFPHPLLWSAGKAELIEQKGTAVGLFPQATYQAAVKTLPKDFLLVIFSDGVLDAIAEENLDRKLHLLRTLSSSEAIENFVSQLQGEQPLPDDLTVLTIKGSQTHG